MADDQDEKTEEATPKRREEFRQRGEVAKSVELAAALMLGVTGVTIILIPALGGPIVDESIAGIWGSLNEYENFSANPIAYLIEASAVSVNALIPVVAFAVFIAFMAHFGQIGPLLAPKAVDFKPEKLDPLKGFKRIFLSKDTLVNLIKSTVKTFILSVVGGILIWKAFNERALSLVWLTPEFFSSYLIMESFKIFLASAIAMILIGILDFFWQRHQMEEKMKMTQQEAKREFKDSQGDPLLKGRRMQRYREMLDVNRLLESVPEASVVINNPTHFSVALRFEMGDVAPKVMAKGADHRALKIREIAAEHNIPMIDNAPLARALYDAAEEDAFIPENFYRAVAEIIAEIMMSKQGKLA
jgi:flagellar biosynthesis protein FlhB